MDVFVFVLSVRCSLLNQPENFQIEIFKHIEHESRGISRIKNTVIF